MTITSPTSHVFAHCLSALHDLALTHPEAAGALALELSDWLDAVAAEADEYAERVVDEP